MNHITMQVHPITKQESVFARKFGLRVFAELDKKGREIAFFGEVHESTNGTIPGKPLITRKKGREPIRVDRLLRSVKPKTKRQEINPGSNLGMIAEHCHTLLKEGPVARGTLQEKCAQHIGLEMAQVRPAFSDLLDVDGYNHLKVAD